MKENNENKKLEEADYLNKISENQPLTPGGVMPRWPYEKINYQPMVLAFTSLLAKLEIIGLIKNSTADLLRTELKEIV